MAELADARTELAATLSEMAVAPPLQRGPQVASVIQDIAVNDEDDNIDFLLYSGEQRALLASFESLPGDADRRQALTAEAQARCDALSMRHAYLCSDLDTVARRGPEHTRVDRANREQEEAIAAWDKAVAAAARDRACYHADL
jgi:hypothetical protein